MSAAQILAEKGTREHSKMRHFTGAFRAVRFGVSLYSYAPVFSNVQ